jgi:EVE domain
MQKHWIGVASADHVARGRADGFMQVCHGKAAPLNRIKPGDGVIYYSPTQVFRAADGLQSFTAIGFARDQKPYQVEMEPGFTPFRRDVDWLHATPAPIRPLLEKLDLTRGKRNWGYGFRYGLLAITPDDFATIGQAMRANLPQAVVSQPANA